MGWPYDTSPFHAGEQMLQKRVGVLERIAQIGPHLIRGAMPDEHRALFETLPFLVAGILDGDGRPWATILVGEPGFIRAPDAGTLRIAARPAVEDPAAEALRVGAAVGLLGIELPTRRRNRANGTVTAVRDDGFEVQVQQSFGNCPKYIQARALVPVPRQPGPAVRLGATLSPEAEALVHHADTFFIASASADAGAPEQARSGGADVSHRGGKRGFVRIDTVDGHHVLTTPDFIGNFLFNTLGNLAVNPRAGLLFPAFDGGDLLQLTGHAEVIWEGAELEAFTGAQRLLRFHLEEGWWRPSALALRADAVEYARQLRETGSWEAVERRVRTPG